MKKLSYFLLFFILVSIPIYRLYPQSLHLAKTRQWVNLGDLDISGNQITVEAKVTLSRISPELGLNIVSKHTNPSNVNYLLRPAQFEINSGGQYHIAIVPLSSIPLNETYHVAGVYDGTMVKLYINGCLVALEKANGNLVQNNFNTAIGQMSSGAYDEQFYGYVDEVRIWNVARTEDEIRENMNDLPNPTQQVGLVTYYKFDNLNPYKNLQGNPLWDGTPVGNPEITGNPFDKFLKPFSLDSIETSYEKQGDKYISKIIIHVSGGFGNYEYSLDNLNYQRDSTFSGLIKGLYKIFVKDANCTIIDSVLVNPPLDTIFVFIPDTTSEAGIEYFPIKLKMANKNRMLLTKIDFLCEISYDMTAFLPYSSSINSCIIKDTIINRRRVLTLKGENILIDNYENLLAEFFGTVLLGDSDKTIISINNFKCSDSNLTIKTRNGSLTIQSCALPLRRVILDNPDTITILQNPASDIVEIKLYSENEGDFKIKIFNLQGGLVYTKIWHHQKSDLDVIPMDFRNYSNGLYQIVIFSSSNVYVESLMLAK